MTNESLVLKVRRLQMTNSPRFLRKSSRALMLSAAAVAVIMTLVGVAAAKQRHQLYAPPVAWGPWSDVASHIGPARFTITVEPIGKTLVVGEVEYFGPKGRTVMPFSKQVRPPLVDCFSGHVDVTRPHDEGFSGTAAGQQLDFDQGTHLRADLGQHGADERLRHRSDRIGLAGLRASASEPGH